MGKAKKSTRKFEKNHLKDTLERRKGFAKIKQRHQAKDKKKARRAKDNPSNGDHDGEAAGATTNGSGKGRLAMEDMDVDDFFQGGLDIPEESRNKRAGKKAKDSEPSKTTRKRKRGDEEGEQLQTDDDASESAEGGVVLSSAGSGSDSGDDDIDAHKRDLEALAEKDPDFYRFLKENDAELLDAAAGDKPIEPEESDGPEAEPPRKKKDKQQTKEEKEKTKKTKQKQKPKEQQDDGLDDFVDDVSGDDGGPNDGEVVTMKMLDKWKTGMTEVHSLRALREVVLAFRAAAHIHDADEKTYKYAIPNADVYHDLLLLALQHLPDVLNHHLPVRETMSGKIRLQTDSKKFKTLAPTLKSHAAAIHHLLTTLSDAATLKMTLSSVVPLLPYFLSLKKILRGLVKTVVGIWSDSAGTEATRITAFLVLRRLVVIGDAGLREVCLKAVYQGLVKGCRNTTVHTLQGINLMKNSAAELWTLDTEVGYTTGFTFIRQLAIHLRSCITNPTKDSYKTVYNWQFVHSLDFWSRVLTLDCATTKEADRGKESALKPLIYPAVQITLGAMRLIPTAQYFPLRFQLMRSLLRLAGSTGTYIPLAPALLEVLTSAEMRKAPKPSTLKSLDFSSSIRAPTAYLRTRVYQDGVGEQVVELLGEFFVQWTKSIAFVELALPVMVMLKRWLKEVSRKEKGKGNRNGKIAAAVVLLVQKLEANSRWIEEHRAKVEFAPNDRAGVEAFLKEVDWSTSPLGAFILGQRKQREEQARLVERARKEEERKRKKMAETEGGYEGGEQGDEGDEGDEEEDGEDDEKLDLEAEEGDDEEEEGEEDEEGEEGEEDEDGEGGGGEGRWIAG